MQKLHAFFLLYLIFFFLPSIMFYVNKCYYFLFSYQVPLAQRIARWTSNPKVLGSIPRWDANIAFWLTFLGYQNMEFPNP